MVRHIDWDLVFKEKDIAKLVEDIIKKASDAVKIKELVWWYNDTRTETLPLKTVMDKLKNREEFFTLSIETGSDDLSISIPYKTEYWRLYLSIPSKEYDTKFKSLFNKLLKKLKELKPKDIEFNGDPDYPGITEEGFESV